jgi:ABC-type sugar transport system ATPase subunit
VVLGVRPEAFEDGATADASLPRLQVTPNVIEELGADAHLIFAVDAPPVDVDERLSAAEAALLAVDGAVFNARVHADTGARPGQSISIAVDPRAFHFFDLETGENITPVSTPEPVAA